MVIMVYKSIIKGLREANDFETNKINARVSRVTLKESERLDPNDTITVTCTCPSCHKDYYINVNESDYDTYIYSDRWHRPLIQDLFAYVPDEWRELLMGGICPDCWDEMFGTDDE